MRKLVHYSDQVLALEDLVTRRQPESGDDKPRGLWVSCEGERDWVSYCMSDNPGRLSAVKHHVVIRGNILKLKSADDLDSFTEEFKVPYRDMKKINFIDWKAVAEVYQGIIITPYIYDRRHHDLVGWYYSWDCASGCIWDPKAVRSITRL